MKVLIDPGHGGWDPGACANGLREADMTLQAGRMLMNLMRQRQHVAYLTRDSDIALGDNKGADLTARCHIEHSFRPDLFVSIHCNAALAETANGFEVWTSPGQTQSDLAAEQIVNAFFREFPTRQLRRDLSDGDQDKESRFRVLTGTLGPAVLVEMGFLSNQAEAIWLRESLPRIAKALADGIEACSGKVAA